MLKSILYKFVTAPLQISPYNLTKRLQGVETHKIIFLEWAQNNEPKLIKKDWFVDIFF